MRGHIIVKRLNKSGNYKSGLDHDKCFSDKSNPNGTFKMVIQPILNNNGEYEIKYMRCTEGYIVSGECYILSDCSEKRIDEKFNSRYSEKWKNFVQTEVNNEADLW